MYLRGQLWRQLGAIVMRAEWRGGKAVRGRARTGPPRRETADGEKGPAHRARRVPCIHIAFFASVSAADGAKTDLQHRAESKQRLERQCVNVVNQKPGVGSGGRRR